MSKSNTREAEVKGLRQRVKDTVLRTHMGYRLYLKYRQGGGRPRSYPDAPWWNAALKTRLECERANEQVRSLGLPPRRDPHKNWDALAALDCILRTTGRRARILDGGADFNSVILPWLFLYGYISLVGNNLLFDGPCRRGPILYEHGDVTGTRFQAETFDAVTCLSVIEHGVDLESYFREMSRILKPGGHLVTSCDYWADGVDTKNQKAYGVPIRVFTRDEMLEALEIARAYGLDSTGDVDFNCQEKAVTWREFGLQYTFLIFTLRKMDGVAGKSFRGEVFEKVGSQNS